jgi:hypothetical protein
LENPQRGQPNLCSTRSKTTIFTQILSRKRSVFRKTDCFYLSLLIHQQLTALAHQHSPPDAFAYPSQPRHPWDARQTPKPGLENGLTELLLHWGPILLPPIRSMRSSYSPVSGRRLALRHGGLMQVILSAALDESKAGSWRGLVRITPLAPSPPSEIPLSQAAVHQARSGSVAT